MHLLEAFGMGRSERLKEVRHVKSVLFLVSFPSDTPHAMGFQGVLSFPSYPFFYVLI